jgi:hypothetical protein
VGDKSPGEHFGDVSNLEDRVVIGFELLAKIEALRVSTIDECNG